MWRVETRSKDGYSGLIARRRGDSANDMLVRIWPNDASAAEIADELERMARDLRASTQTGIPAAQSGAF